MSLHNSYAGYGGADDPVRQIALKMRSVCNGEADHQPVPAPIKPSMSDEFPEVDSDEVFANLWIGNA